MIYTRIIWMKNSAKTKNNQPAGDRLRRQTLEAEVGR